MENFSDGKGSERPKPVWADEGPGRARGFEVVHPTVGKPVQGFLLGDDVAGVMLHWLGDGSTPCVEGECQRPHTARDPYWHGYAPIVVRGAVVPTIVGVSAAAYRQLSRLAEQYDGLHGLHVRLTRQSGERSRVVVQVLSEEKVTKLPPYFDPRPMLMAMWFPELAPYAEPLQGAAVEAAGLARLARLSAALFAPNGRGKGGGA